MRTQRMWTSEETNILLNMRLNNDKITYIAYKLKRTPASVSSKLKFINEMKHYKKWTDEEWQQAIGLHKLGLSYRQIGQILGRKQTTIKGKFQSMKNRGVI